MYVTVFSISRDLGIDLIFPGPDTGGATDHQQLSPDVRMFTNAFRVGEPSGERIVVAFITSLPADFSRQDDPVLATTDSRRPLRRG